MQPSRGWTPDVEEFRGPAVWSPPPRPPVPPPNEDPAYDGPWSAAEHRHSTWTWHTPELEPPRPSSPVPPASHAAIQPAADPASPDTAPAAPEWSGSYDAAEDYDPQANPSDPAAYSQHGQHGQHGHFDQRGRQVPAAGELVAGPGTAATPGAELVAREEYPDGAQVSASATVLAGARRVHVGAGRVGSGRTTVAAGLAMAMSVNRHDRVVAVDGGVSQAGSLAVRVGSAGRGVGVRELVQTAPGMTSLTDVRRFLTKAAPTGLEVLSGQVAPSAPALSLAEVWYALELLESWFPVVVVDPPAAWHDLESASLLLRADTVVVTVAASAVELAGVDQVFAMFDQVGRGDLRAGAVVAVVETVPPRLTARTKRRVGQLASRVHGAVLVPYDPVLAGGRPFTWQRLRRRTRQSFEELAAVVESAPG